MCLQGEIIGAKYDWHVTPPVCVCMCVHTLSLYSVSSQNWKCFCTIDTKSNCFYKHTSLTFTHAYTFSILELDLSHYLGSASTDFSQFQPTLFIEKQTKCWWKCTLLEKPNSHRIIQITAGRWIRGTMSRPFRILQFCDCKNEWKIKQMPQFFKITTDFLQIWAKTQSTAQCSFSQILLPFTGVKYESSCHRK